MSLKNSTLKEKLNAIINSDTEMDKGVLIINFMEDSGFSLCGNGWLDDDKDTLDKILESEDAIMSELERIGVV